MKQTVIDFVITYVDGSDSYWVKKKRSYDPDVHIEDDRSIRYRSWENLVYWFRGVEKYCPWVRKVYLITDHQVPDWINQECEKLYLLNHEDFIPREYLPLFNSRAIEFNFNKIEGLSENIVYFNDDVFITNYMEPGDFFVDNLPCDYAIEAPITETDSNFAHVLLNNMLAVNQIYDRRVTRKRIIRKLLSPVDMRGMLINFAYNFLNYRRFFGFENRHTALSFKKSSFEDAWNLFYEEIDSTCRHRFRNKRDVNLYLIQVLQYMKGIYSPSNIRKKSHFFALNDGQNSNIEEAAKAIRSSQYKMVCLNENNVSDFENAKTIINDAFDSILSDKSSFEK